MAQTVAISGSSTDRLDTPSQPRSLVSKLAEVMAQVKRIPKRGYNSFHGYKYVNEADLADAIRDELSERNVMLISDVESVERIEGTPTAKGRPQFLTTVFIRWTFMDGETGETISFRMPGTGIDGEDKGLYKAITGAEKYALMKTFLVPTGDDPEKDSKGDVENAMQAQEETKQKKLRAQAQETAKEEGGKPGKEVTFDGVVMMDGEEKTAKSGRKYMKVEFCENCPDCDGSGEIGQDDSGNAICKRCSSSGLAPKHTALLYQDRYDLLAAIGRAKGKMASAKCEEVTHSKGNFYVITDFEQVPF